MFAATATNLTFARAPFDLAVARSIKHGQESKRLILSYVAGKPVQNRFAPAVAASAAQSPFVSAVESVVHGGGQLKGLVPLDVDGKPIEKRYVLRTPSTWNGSLVIGAHGGGGGNNFDRSGKVIGTDETALDDVIGRHALANGFVYASVDRDGSGGGRAGLGLTTQFTTLVRTEMTRRGLTTPRRT